MTTFGELVNVKAEETEPVSGTFGAMPIRPLGPNRNRKITGHRYDIVGYKHNPNGIKENGRRDKRFKDTVIEFKNVSARNANSIRLALRKDGCYRVDKLEVTSFVKDTAYLTKEIIFNEKNYTPALEGRIPGPIEMSEAKILLARNINHRKNLDTFARNNVSIETRSDSGKVLIFEKISGNLVCNGTEEDAVFFILNAPLSIENYVLYVNSKIYERLTAND